MLVIACLALLGAMLLESIIPVAAAEADPGSSYGVTIPNFWDPRAKPTKPDLGSIRLIRFLTDDDYPPLHFVGFDGNLTGFSVDLARAVCDKLKVPCTIQARRFDTLLDSLAEKRGDAIAAAIPITTKLRARFSVSHPYHRMPARFVVRQNTTLPAPTAAALKRRRVGVVSGTVHEAFLKAYFPGTELKTYVDLALAEAALKRGDVDYVFADGMTLSLWLDGTEADGCCAFTGGPYLSTAYFSEGIGFIVRPEDDTLRQALNWGLQQVWDDGTYANLYLRYFPISFY
jgi:polar amino acid transport system substrate-binding protein